MKEYLYKAKDNRYRVVIANDGKVTSKSYPRYIMEKALGRKLLSSEDVHHLDGDTTNNDISNLVVIDHAEHDRLHATKFFDKEAVCEVCNATFIWKGKRQQKYYSDIRAGKPRIISCSNSCSSLYGRLKQLNRV